MRFTKMQGVGNDFVVVAEEEAAGGSVPELALTVCERHTGVGADGLLVVGPGEGEVAFTFRMFNPDGTEDMCGNGLRCACLWAMRQGIIRTSTEEFRVWTKEGVRSCRMVSVGDDQRRGIVEVDMGRPKFAPQDIPCLAGEGAVRVLDYPLDVAGRTYSINGVNTGSTHTAIFADRPPAEEIFLRDSPLIENHPLFPERTSVLWCWPAGGSRFGVRIWERGAGETLGCGTGACAVAVLALVTGLVAESDAPISIESRGGTLDILWRDRETILMTGPAETVFEGSI